VVLLVVGQRTMDIGGILGGDNNTMAGINPESRGLRNLHFHAKWILQCLKNLLLKNKSKER